MVRKTIMLKVSNANARIGLKAYIKALRDDGETLIADRVQMAIEPYEVAEKQCRDCEEDCGVKNIRGECKKFKRRKVDE